jgi:hypothetical protein
MKTLRKVAGSVCFVLMLAASNLAAAVNYQDWWLNPSIIGAGVNIGQQGDTIAAAWYLFDASGQPTWLTFSGQLVGNQVSGNLYKTEVLGSVSTVSVGSASFTFTSDSTALLNYTYDGQAGSINLERFSFAPSGINPVGYMLALSGTNSGCANPSENGAVLGFGLTSLSRNGNTFNFDMAIFTVDFTTGNVTPMQCSLTATASQQGSLYQGSGSFTCDDGTAGTWSFQDMRVSPDRLFARISTKVTIGGTCQLDASLGGPNLIQ